MNKGNNSESNNKKGFPGIVLLFVIALIVILAVQNFSQSKGAKVSFTHQLEHLVNMDLIDPLHSKKVSLNDNLVTFSGSFRDELTESAKERYRFLSLLQNHQELDSKKASINTNLNKLQTQVVASATYFLELTGRGLKDGKFVVVPTSFDSQDRKNAIILKKIDSTTASVTLPSLTKMQSAMSSSLSEDSVNTLGRELNIFISELSSNQVGIGNEKFKSFLKEQKNIVDSTLKMGSDAIVAKYKVFSKVLNNLKTEVNTLFSEQEGVYLYDLRVVRNYVENVALYDAVSKDFERNTLQLAKAKAKVANVIWFFNNQELSTEALSKKNVEEYKNWFVGAEKEWEAFAENKNLAFKAPDQPRNMVLEKTFKSEEPAPNYFNYLFTFLPIILIGVLLYFVFSRQVKGGGSNAMSFGKSPAKMLNKSTQKVTFDDVAGVDEAKEELEEVVDFLKDPTRFTKLGARIPKGVLLVGPPGTGKTLLAKAVAGEAGVPFFSISGSDFVEMFVGVGASRVRDLFDQGRKNSPCIIFIDEIDAVGRHRGSGMGGGHDEREQTLNQLLVEIDGMDSQVGVILVAATNRPDVLDNALLRPGRFDRTVHVEVPDYRGRLAIIKVHSKSIKLDESVDLKEIANRTSGCSGADLENILNEAALLAARKLRKAVIQEDLRMAQEKVIFGKERKSFTMEEEDKCRTAHHEAGHAVLALKLDTADPVNKVTIIPRGSSLGATHFELKKNRVNYLKKELEDQLVVLMGGRVAEEMLSHNPSNGAQQDIKQATAIAKSMVCKWGMSEKLGMVSYGDDRKDLMAGFQEREYSDETAKIIDDEVKILVNVGYEKAKEMLQEYNKEMVLMAEMLLEFETLERSDLDHIMEGTWDVDKKRSKMEEIEGLQQKEPPPIPKNLFNNKPKDGSGGSDTPAPQPS